MPEQTGTPTVTDADAHAVTDADAVTHRDTQAQTEAVVGTVIDAKQ